MNNIIITVSDDLTVNVEYKSSNISNKLMGQMFHKAGIECLELSKTLLENLDQQ